MGCDPSVAWSGCLSVWSFRSERAGGLGHCFFALLRLFAAVFWCVTHTSFRICSAVSGPSVVCPWRQRGTAPFVAYLADDVPSLKFWGGVVSTRLVRPVVGLPAFPSVVAYLSGKDNKFR